MTADEVVLAVVFVGVLALCAAIWGSLRRRVPTRAQRYKTGTPEERRRIEEEIQRKPWLAPFVLPTTGWSIALGVALFIIFHFGLWKH
jgi:hypothetical protein